MNIRELMRELQRYPADYEVDVCLVCSEVDHALIAEVDGVDVGSIAEVGRLRLSAVTEAAKEPIRKRRRRSAAA